MRQPNQLYAALVASIVILPSLFLAGCSDTPTVENEDPAKAQARLDLALKIRGYFDKSNGKFDDLSEEDKKTVIKLMGGEKMARDGFAQMQAPAGGPSTVGGGPTVSPSASSSGPGSK